MTSVITISRRHAGLAPLRVVVVRRARRAARAARGMAAAGLLAWQIRRATRLAPQQIEAILAAGDGLWSPAQRAEFERGAR